MYHWGMTVSKHIKIYRVEHARGGRGPYLGDLAVAGAMQLEHQKLGHPTPLKDGIETMTVDDYCGFVAREHVDKWFYGFKAKLAHAGFHIAIYEVPMNLIKFGRKQVAFERGDLLPIETMPLLR